MVDLHIAGRRIVWVAACAGIIVFGTLMAMRVPGCRGAASARQGATAAKHARTRRG